MVKLATMFSGGLAAPEFAFKYEDIDFETVFACEWDKYAREQYLKFHGEPKEAFYEDISKFDGTKHKGDIDILIWGSSCFKYNTKVLTEDGYKNIIDIRKGDNVLTHKNRWRKVLNRGVNEKEIYTLKAMGIADIDTTSEHPFYVRTMKRKKDKELNKYIRTFTEPYWKEIKDISIIRNKSNQIKEQDYIGIPLIKDEENPLNITEDEAFIIGRYIADGYTRKDFRKEKGRSSHRYWSLFLSIGKGKLEHFKSRIKDTKYSVSKEKGNTNTVAFYSKRIVQIVEEHCGCGAKNKFISPTLLKLPNNILEILLEGYMSGDGCKIKDFYQSNSISKELIMSLNLAILKVYKKSSIFHYHKTKDTPIIEGRVVNQEDTYQTRFFKIIKKQQHPIFIDDVMWYPVREIIKTNDIETVYNIEVEEDNSHTANNCIVHNCQNFSMSGNRKGLDGDASKYFIDGLKRQGEIQPKIFIFENVKGMKSSNNGEDFKYAIKAFKDQGYYLHSKVLNTRDFGIPQNRERIFVIGFKNKEGFLDFDYPEPFPLTTRLKDLLEDSVDEKYYLSDKIIKGFQKHKERHQEKGNGFAFEPKAVEDIEKINCLSCGYGSRATDTYLVEPKLNQIGNIDTDGLSSCLNANGGGLGANTGLYIDTKIGAIRGRNPDNPKSRKAGEHTEQMLELNENGTSNCLTTVQKDNVVVEVQSATKKGYENATLGDSINLSYPESKTRRGRVGKQVSQTLECACNQAVVEPTNELENFRIRKLTPREYFRLQGVKDEDIDLVVSNTQSYKIAGNAISVNVMQLLIRNIFKKPKKISTTRRRNLF